MHRVAKTLKPVVFVALSLVSSSTRAEEGAASAVSFIRQVAPILVRQCQGCHGAKTAESNYRLDTFQLMMHSGDFGSAPITAGDLDNSEIHRLITAQDADERMPNNGDRLTDAEIDVITAWILQGAHFDGQDAAALVREQIPRDIPHPAAPEKYPRAIPITAMTFAPDGGQLLVGGYHELLIWELTSGTLVARVGNIPQRTFGMAFSPDGSWLAVAGGAPGVSGEVRLIPWRRGPKSDATPKILATQEDVFFDVAFDPSGNALAAGGADGYVRVFETESGLERLKIESHADWVRDVSYSPDGKYIATASRDKTAKIFDASNGDLLATHSEHNAPVRAIAFAADGKTVVSAGGPQIHIWNVEDSKLVREITGFEKEVNALLVNGESVVSASADRSVRHCYLKDGALVRSFPKQAASVLSLAWHDPSHRISSGCFDGSVTVWNLESGIMEKQFLSVPPTAAPTN